MVLNTACYAQKPLLVLSWSNSLHHGPILQYRLLSFIVLLRKRDFRSMYPFLSDLVGFGFIPADKRSVGILVTETSQDGRGERDF